MAEMIASLAADPARMAELRAKAAAAAPQFSRDALARRMIEVLSATVPATVSGLQDAQD
jgi:hypothetical protein